MTNQTIPTFPVSGEIFSAVNLPEIEKKIDHQVPENKKEYSDEVVLRIKKLQQIILDEAKLRMVREALKTLEHHHASYA